MCSKVVFVTKKPNLYTILQTKLSVFYHYLFFDITNITDVIRSIKSPKKVIYKIITFFKLKIFF